LTLPAYSVGGFFDFLTQKGIKPRLMLKLINAKRRAHHRLANSFNCFADGKTLRVNRTMENIQKLDRFFNHHKTLQIFIAASAAAGTAYYAVVIYASRRQLYCCSGWLETTEERAWFYAYQLACEWRDKHFPDARIVISSIEERQNEQRRVA